jgi:uncharacterized membrane protein
VGAAAAVAGSEKPFFYGLGDLQGGTPTAGSQALAVSADGTYVVGSGTSHLGTQAFLWTLEDGMVPLGELAGGEFGSIATGVSFSGTTVVGWSHSANGQEAFRWRLGFGMEGLGDFADGQYASKANAVSAAGAAIVGSGSLGNGEIQAFRWTLLDGLVGLGDCIGGGVGSVAQGISADGKVVVGWGSSGLQGVREAFRWTAEGGMECLGFLPDAFLLGSEAHAVSLDGKVIVGSGWGPVGIHAWRWTSEEGMVSIGDLPGGGGQPFAFAFGVNFDGSVMVGSGLTDVGAEAFVWDEINGMRNLRLELESAGLDLHGWVLSEARAVTSDGTIVVGKGKHNGVDEGWIASVPPLVCIADFNDDGFVGTDDLLELLENMGACDVCDDCPYDIDGNCEVGNSDITALLFLWGPCRSGNDDDG